MSRIGNLPITVPGGVTVTVDGSHVSVKGPKGELSRTVHADMNVALNDGVLTVTRPSEVREHRALHGLTRALLNNMVVGVSTGFQKNLEIQGVGYKAEERSGGIRMIVGYSHPVDYDAPEGVTISLDGPTKVKIDGADKQKVGQVAAELRKIRPPEPYKGKGIRYVGEHVRTKAGKTGTK